MVKRAVERAEGENVRATPKGHQTNHSERPTVAIVPSCDTFESHFTPLGVRPEDLATGAYRGSWVTRYAEDLLRRYGIRCVLVSPGRSIGNWTGTVMDVHLTPVPAAYPAALTRLWRGPLRGLGSYLSSGLLAPYLSKYDVLYVQEYAFGRAAALVDQGLGPKMITAHHGTSIDEAHRYTRRRLSRVAALTGLTEGEVAKVKQVLGEAAPHRVLCIPNWVEDAWFEEPALTAPVALPRVLWFGRMEDRNKDLTTLLEGFRLLGQARPAELVLVGDGPDRRMLEDRVRRDGALRDSVRFTGRMDDVAALRTEVACADIVVNTSRVEGFPLAMLEAGATGRPLVLSELPYTADLAELPDVWLFQTGDAVQLAVRLRESLDAETHPDAQRAWVKNRYSADRSLTLLSQLIMNVWTSGNVSRQGAADKQS